MGEHVKPQIQEQLLLVLPSPWTLIQALQQYMHDIQWGKVQRKFQEMCKENFRKISDKNDASYLYDYESGKSRPIKFHRKLYIVQYMWYKLKTDRSVYHRRNDTDEIISMLPMTPVSTSIS